MTRFGNRLTLFGCLWLPFPGIRLSADDYARHRPIQNFRSEDQVCSLLAALAIERRGFTEGHNVFHFRRIDHVFQDALAEGRLVDAF
jgi:hypothetical protein